MGNLWFLLRGVVALCLAQGFALAQTDPEVGKPTITNYTTEQYRAHPQNWGIIQDDRGIMYFGNSIGLLEYDGASWHLLQLPNKSAVNGFAKDSNGRIYVGGQGDFGYLAPDSVGQMQFISLLEKVRPEDRQFTSVEVQCNSSGVYFGSDSRLFRWADNQMRVWKPRAQVFTGSFLLGETYYIREFGLGLMQMAGDSLQLVPDGAKFAQGSNIEFMLRYPAQSTMDSEKILLGTRTEGLFLYDGVSFRPFQTEADTFLRNNIITDGAMLPDGTFALTTARAGVAIVDQEGGFRQVVDKAAGLQNDTVFSVFTDHQGATWLSLNNGIARVEIPSPLSFFGATSGLKGIVINSIRHQGMLYVGTFLNAFYLQSSGSSDVSGAPMFRRVSGIASGTWSFVSLHGELLAATDAGVYRIQGSGATLVEPSGNRFYRAAWVYRSRQDSNRVFVGLFDGLASLRYRGPGRWHDEGQINEIHEEVRSIVESDDGALWLGTQNTGILRVVFPVGKDGHSMQLDRPKITRFGAANGLPEGGVSVHFVAGREFFATKDAIFRFDASRSTFVVDSTFSMVSFGGSAEEYNLKEDKNGDVWVNFGAETVLAKHQSDGSYVPEVNAFVSLNGYYVIYPEDDGVTWFGGVEKMVRYDPGVRKDYALDYPVLIRRVATGKNRVIFGGALPGVASPEEQFSNSMEKSARVELPYEDNALRFEFAAPSYDNAAANAFQWRLEGFDNNWSDWSPENRRDYTNLPPGQYRFRVKARNFYQYESSESVYEFNILPPWYRTWWAYAVYFVVLGGLVFLADRVQRGRLVRRERERAQLREAHLRANEAEARSQAAESEAKTLQVENERKKNIELLSEIGKEVTASLSIKHVIETVYAHVNKLMDASVFGIGIYSAEEDSIAFPGSKEKGKTLPPFSNRLDDENRPAVWCFKNQKEVFTNDYEKEYSKYIKTLQTAVEGDNPASMIYLPVTNQDKKIGVITAQSFEKNAYTDYHLNILRNLATYAAIALDNADAYRRLNATIDELKATQQQLLTQEKLASLGALTAGIAHEIKNPLNFVNNFSQLAQKFTKSLQEEVRAVAPRLQANEMAAIEEYLTKIGQLTEKIAEHGKRADNIVKSMLQHSRGQSGERQETDLNAMLEEDLNLAYHGMRAQDTEFNITIEKEFDQAVGKFPVVPQDLSRVFLNIITNGFYETHKKKIQKGEAFTPTLSVRSKALGSNKVEVRIRDNGNGIPAHVQQKLFEPFFTTKPTGQGTGLGLSISYDIVVQEHRGEITFDTKDGEFTEFVITLPRNGGR